MSFSSMGGPAAVDRQSDACDRSRSVACQKYRERAEFFDSRETLVGLLCQQHVMDDLLAGDAVGFGLAIDLRLDQWCIDITRADRVAVATLFVRPKARNLPQAAPALLRLNLR